MSRVESWDRHQNGDLKYEAAFQKLCYSRCCLADFDTCWRATEAAEASDILHLGPNHLHLSKSFYNFSVIFSLKCPIPLWFTAGLC